MGKQTDSQRSGRWLVAVSVGQFAAAGLLALLIVGLATAEASRRVGQREAISNARTTTLVRARSFVEPALTDTLVSGDTSAKAALDAVVTANVLDRSLVRVKVWTSTGTVVYSDEPRLIGRRFALGEDEQAALRTGLIVAETTDLTKPENRFERQHNKLLEVYLPVQTPSGRLLLFEAYYRYDAVVSGGSQLWRNFAPISLGALVMLELVQIPLAWSLAHRLRERQREREQLLLRALDASELDRRQIASDLHDGVVQDLAGVGFALAAGARSSEGPMAPVELEANAGTVRDAIQALRSLVVDLYPPDLAEEGLPSAIRDLLERPQLARVATEIDITALGEPIPLATAGLLYRSVQEGLRNVTRHAAASRVTVRVGTHDGTAMIEVTDDGQGVDEGTLGAKADDGHLGLKVLTGLVADAGGTVTFRSAPGKGSTLRVEVPAP